MTGEQRQRIREERHKVVLARYQYERRLSFGRRCKGCGGLADDYTLGCRQCASRRSKRRCRDVA